MEELTGIQAPVAKELEAFRTDYTDSLKSSTKRLQDAIRFLLDSTGKQIRPLLTLLSAKACGEVSEGTIRSAVLLELLHTATLVHDDVVDETKQRRGIPSLNAVVDNKVAVLTGDYILSSALIRAAQMGDLRIIRIVSQLGRELSEGEIAELETAEDICLDEEHYTFIIGKKTASLLAACAEIGAISSGATAERIALCRQFGEYLGYCFQIRDDIFDYYPDSDIGKPTGNDIREGKITLPLLHTLQTVKGQETEQAMDIIRSRRFTEENILFLLAFARNGGGITYAEGVMQRYGDKAIALLEQLPASAARSSLQALAHYIISRKK